MERETERRIEVQGEYLAKAVDEKQPIILYLDRDGYIVRQGFAATNPEEDTLRLTEFRSTDRPSFEICTAIDGRLTDWQGEEMTIADLSRVVKEAEDNRVDYFERAEEATAE
jgi:hypothetical protein